MAGSVPPRSFLKATGGRGPAEQLREQLGAVSAFIGPKTSFVSFTIDVPAPLYPSLMGALPGQPFVAYGDTIGLGVAAELRLDRLDVATANDWASRLLADENIAGRETPSIFCGAAFEAEATGTGRWRDFPAFYLLLPRWVCRAAWDRLALTLTLSVAELENHCREDQVVGEIDRIVASLEGAPPAEEPAAETNDVVQMPPADWEALVAGALDDISAGRFQKLVLARTATIQANQPWRADAVFRRLMATRDCSPFAARLGSTTFLGATPEGLVSSGREGHFRVDALAGTIPADADTAMLTHSHKNREEHRLVVEEIGRRLRPLCSELDIPPEPVTFRLGDVVHLKTPISGRRRDGVHLLDLAGALHPTPAVGGLPGKPAVDWIRAHEPEPRGWYSGFVGWLDRFDSGRLGVAIRCGLLSDREACLYTGAGIVAGSDPADEYQETGWKQRPFLRALGVEQ